MLSDTTLIQTNHHKIIFIPSNREYLVVSFQLSKAIGEMIARGKAILFSVYDKKELISAPLSTLPNLQQELQENTFELEVNISYNDYIITVTDSSGNLLEAICLNVW